VTVVLGLSYWYWTTTPTYALSQIVGAVKNKDSETFEKYVDVESIAYRAIDDVLHGPARESGMFGNFDSMIGVGIIGLFKPEIAEIAKTQVLKFIESGQLSGSMKDAQKGTLPDGASNNSRPHSPKSLGSAVTVVKADPEKESLTAEFKHHGGLPDNSMVTRYAKKLKVTEQLKEYGLSKQGFKGIDYLKIEGPTALIGFKFHSDKFARDIIVEIKMEDAGGYWRVTELSNLNSLITIYLETKAKQDSTSYLQAVPAKEIRIGSRKNPNLSMAL